MVLKRGGGKTLFCCLENIIVIVFLFYLFLKMFLQLNPKVFFQVLKYELFKRMHLAEAFIHALKLYILSMNAFPEKP